MNIFVLVQVNDLSVGSRIKWLSASNLRLNPSVSREWDCFVLNLYRAGIFLKNLEEKLIWTQNVIEGTVTARLDYECIMEQEQFSEHFWWANLLWGNHLPLKTGSA